MTRWGPDAPGRLRKAAMELYSKRGFADTTVADIAARAGLTERTFFRHFTDKREVLFAGSDQLQQAIIDAMAQAPASATPIVAVASGLVAAGRFFNSENRDFSRLRQAIITANAELRERELIKLASLASAIAEALRRRGAPDPAASLIAEAGMGVFRVTFTEWIAGTRDESWPVLVNESLGQLKELVAAH